MLAASVTPKWRLHAMTALALTAMLAGAASLSFLLTLPLSTSRVSTSTSLPRRLRDGVFPLAFEPNIGQAGYAARFLARMPGGTLQFAPSEVVMSLAQPVAPQPKLTSPPTGKGQPAVIQEQATLLRLQFIGASPQVALTGEAILPARVSYLLGDDPSRWHTGLPTYGGITYKALYPGVDLTYAGKDARGLKGTYTVAPQADPTLIKWRYDRAQSLTVDPQGNLQITIEGSGIREQRSGLEGGNSALSTQHSKLTEAAPVAWQDVGGVRLPVEARYVVASDGSVGFALGRYDHALPLVLDPELDYSTYLGGDLQDAGTGVAVDGQGNTYVTGLIGSANFPTMDPYQPGYGGGRRDAFVAKFDPTGTHLLYATYLGGSGDDSGWGIAVDRIGNAYVAGYTDSTNFPLSSAYQPANAGGKDVFVARLNAQGSALDYSTYLGGSGRDEGWGIAVDSEQNAYITGITGSPDFPTASPLQASMAGVEDAFVTRVNAAGSALIYSTYLGGSLRDGALGIALDRDGNAYLAGGSISTDFPTTASAFQPTNHDGNHDAIVVKVSHDGGQLVYSTYLGGSGGDQGWAIAVSSAGDAALTGYTGSTDFPTLNPLQPANGGNTDSFATLLNNQGSGLVYSTYLGGNGHYDGGYGVAADAHGNFYFAGLTSSTDFPTVNALQSTSNGSDDAFISKINAGGASFGYSTYLGGSGNDYGYGLALDPFGNAVIAGQATSQDFPTADAFQPANAGGLDVVVFKIVERCVISFTDVPQGSTFYDDIHCMACRGNVQGYADGTFRPNSSVTRGQLAKMVSNAAGLGETHANQTFEDVPPGSAFHPFIERLASRGIIGGYPCGEANEPCVAPENRPYFRPNTDVTRAQTSKIVSIAASVAAPPLGSQTFEDVPLTYPFYEWIEGMAIGGIIAGHPCGGEGEPCIAPLNRPYYRPAANVTRGQSATIVAHSFFPDCQPPEHPVSPKK
ncbi:MAG TPA: SBBP repeat-containing protein [Chloroflexia bacterium]|nr:SBBP repeat-containing protein [Chloroflexia bacterium]